MSTKEIIAFYNENRNRKIKYNNYTGVIAGYTSYQIIGRTNSPGLNNWDSVGDGGYRENHTKGDSYFVIHRPEDCIFQKTMLPSDYAEIYIKEHFSVLDDETRDIYINIFTAGYEETL